MLFNSKMMLISVSVKSFNLLANMTVTTYSDAWFFGINTDIIQLNDISLSSFFQMFHYRDCIFLHDRCFWQIRNLLYQIITCNFRIRQLLCHICYHHFCILRHDYYACYLHHSMLKINIFSTKDQTPIVRSVLYYLQNVFCW